MKEASWMKDLWQEPVDIFEDNEGPVAGAE